MNIVIPKQAISQLTKSLENKNMTFTTKFNERAQGEMINLTC